MEGQRRARLAKQVRQVKQAGQAVRPQGRSCVASSLLTPHRGGACLLLYFPPTYHVPPTVYRPPTEDSQRRSSRVWAGSGGAVARMS